MPSKRWETELARRETNPEWIEKVLIPLIEKRYNIRNIEIQYTAPGKCNTIILNEPEFNGSDLLSLVKYIRKTFGIEINVIRK